jgi:hypothetical protein
MIYFLDLVILESIEKRLESRFLLGDDEATTRISIDPMYERRAKCETIIPTTEIVLHELDEGYLFGLMVTRMDIDTRRFIDYHEILIFVEDKKKVMGNR